MSIRLHLIVEGQTEETFVNRVLTPYLSSFKIWSDARRVLTGRKKGRIFRGGMTDYSRAKRDITLWIKEDGGQDSFFTTMFDLYGLPDDFPGFSESQDLAPLEKITKIEAALERDISHPRFIPYLQLHEFEAILFSDPQKLDWQFFEHGKAINSLIQIASQFDSPEFIDDGAETSPSKRIISEIPQYKNLKPIVGPVTAEKIGLSRIREKCKHFDAWLSRLERLDKP